MVISQSYVHVYQRVEVFGPWECELLKTLPDPSFEGVGQGTWSSFVIRIQVANVEIRRFFQWCPEGLEIAALYFG
jgi:hypothetical protein